MKIRNLLFLLPLLILNMAWAGKNTRAGVTFDYDDSVSLQIWHGVPQLKPGTTVYGASFYSETPDTVIFPPTMTGVTFIDCLQDNIIIPPGNVVKTLSRESPKRFQVNNDGRDWEIDAQNQPTKVLNPEYWYDLGFSTDPADIPAKKIDDPSQIPKKKP